MAKATNVAAAPAEGAGSALLTLTEFCTRLSETNRRVPLIGAFEFTEKSAGRVKDTEAAYKERFEAFVNKPA